MKYCIREDGNSHGSYNNIPEGFVESAEPAPDQVLGDNWASDPMNQMICWKDKTAQELDNEKTIEASKLANPIKAHAAVLETLWDAIPDLQNAYPNPGGKGKLKKAANQAYKAKL